MEAIVVITAVFGIFGFIYLIAAGTRPAVCRVKYFENLVLAATPVLLIVSITLSVFLENKEQDWTLQSINFPNFPRAALINYHDNIEKVDKTFSYVFPDPILKELVERNILIEGIRLFPKIIIDENNMLRIETIKIIPNRFEKEIVYVLETDIKKTANF